MDRFLFALFVLLVSSVAFGVNDMPLQNPVQDGNISFRVNDGGVRKTVATMRGSDATFNFGSNLFGYPVSISSSSTDLGAGKGLVIGYNSSNQPLMFNVTQSNGYAYMAGNAIQTSGSDGATYAINGMAYRAGKLDGNAYAIDAAATGTAGNAITWIPGIKLSSGGEVIIGRAGASIDHNVYGGFNVNGPNAENALTVNSTGSGVAYAYFNTLDNGSTAGWQVTSAVGGIIYARNNGQIEFPNIGVAGGAANAYLDGGTGRLSIVSSSLKYKQEIRNVTENQSQKIFNLRPVSYRSKIQGDDQKTRYFGLIAEEVSAVEPMLALYKNGEPSGVQYDRLSVLLLIELKKLRAEFDEYRESHP